MTGSELEGTNFRMITPLTETQALPEDALVREAQRGESCRTWRLRRACAAVACGAEVRRHRRGWRSAWSRRVVRLAASSAFMPLLLPVAGLVYYVYFDRSGLLTSSGSSVSSLYDRHGLRCPEQGADRAGTVSPRDLLR